MSLSTEISAPLKRPVLPAGRFSGLFPKPLNKKVYLGDGQNSIADGVNFIAELAEEYAWQTEEVAPILKSATLKETVDAINFFLYNYFQYQADDQTQNLRPPARSWKDRHKGIDCKDYTLLALCICLNLGITTAIRRVRQPGFYPELWTHVYLVVPKNQKGNFEKQLNRGSGHYTIDGTRPDNTFEVDFTEKKDKLMQAHQYVALLAPATAKMGEKEVNQFKEFLSNRGFSVAQVEKIGSYLSKLIRRGFDPILYGNPKTRTLNIRPSAKVSGFAFPFPKGKGAPLTPQETRFETYIFSGDVKQKHFSKLFRV